MAGQNSKGGMFLGSGGGVLASATIQGKIAREKFNERVRNAKIRLRWTKGMVAGILDALKKRKGDNAEISRELFNNEAEMVEIEKEIDDLAAFMQSVVDEDALRNAKKQMENLDQKLNPVQDVLKGFCRELGVPDPQQ